MNKSLIICITFMFISFRTFSQFKIFVTVFNTDRPLLRVLTQKASYNVIIYAQNRIIHNGLKDIRDSKIEIRKKEYEENKYDRSLKFSLAMNFGITNLLLGSTIVAPSSFPHYFTKAKKEYFIRELLVNNVIAVQIALEKNSRIRNVNTQELYSLNGKMLTKLKKRNKPVYKQAAFVLLASILSKSIVMKKGELNQVLRLGL